MLAFKFSCLNIGPDLPDQLQQPCQYTCTCLIREVWGRYRKLLTRVLKKVAPPQIRGSSLWICHPCLTPGGGWSSGSCWCAGTERRQGRQRRHRQRRTSRAFWFASMLWKLLIQDVHSLPSLTHFARVLKVTPVLQEQLAKLDLL